MSLLQSWVEITSQTEGLSRLLRQHAEDLNSGPLSKLSLLIRERQQLRKTYSEQWQQLHQELTKVGRLAGCRLWAACWCCRAPELLGFQRGGGEVEVPDHRPSARKGLLTPSLMQLPP